MDERKQHQENLDFIAKSLANKPVTTDLFRQIIEFNSKNLVPVEVTFPKLKVANIEFIDELSHNSIVVNNLGSLIQFSEKESIDPNLIDQLDDVDL